MQSILYKNRRIISDYFTKLLFYISKIKKNTVHNMISFDAYKHVINYISCFL